MMAIVSAVASFASGPFLLFAELHAHPIASSWEWNAVPPAQFG
jgi:hypothetical protein